MSDASSCLFGPVISRRLGRSLGVDIIPFKSCPYDCVYCEQGRTTNHTLERRDYRDITEALEELRTFLDSHLVPDYITISGAGEPTLHRGLGTLIAAIKAITEVPVAVITNGALLWQPEVREALQQADVVLPSLDGGNERLFKSMDRPVSGLSFEQVLAGLIDFRDTYPGEIWLEVFLAEGINDDDESLRELARLALKIRPDKIQLNTVERPPARSSVKALSPERLEACALFFHPVAEIISPRYEVPESEGRFPKERPVLEMLRRRPCPLAEIASGLGYHPLETSKLLLRLVREGKIREECRGEVVFFMYVEEPTGP